MKNPIKPLGAMLLGLSLLCAPAFAGTSQLVDLVLEKRVMGALHSGNKPMINPSSYQAQDFTLAPAQLNGPLRTVLQPVPREAQRHAVTKRYQVAPEPEHFQSLIRIYDAASGRLRGQLNVGRRIQSLLASPTSNRLYVLCGGYFGSIWEIDTTRDVVLRKLPNFTPEEPIPPLWNPRNMALMSDGQTLAVGSGKLQLIDLIDGRPRQELELPDGAVEVSSLQALPGNALGVGLRDTSGQYHRYHLPADSRGLEPGGGAAAGARSLKVQVRTFSAPPPAISRLLFMSSRNSDYVRMIDRQSFATVGVLPVDFTVDDLVLTPDRKRLFVYNRRFGQVSVIELSTRSPETFSVIRRYRDKRFQSNGAMQLAAGAGQVFLWDGQSQILAGFDAVSLYPRMKVNFGVRLNPPMSSPVWVSQPAHQRFYVREGRLYAEFMDQDPSALPMELSLGASVIDMQLSNDRRRLYALTDSRELVEMDTMSHQVSRRRDLLDPKNPDFPRQESLMPRYLALSSDDRMAYVIDANQGLLRMYQLNDTSPDFKFVKEVALDIGINQPQQITLYDPRLAQLIEVELPRYLNDVVRVTQ